MLRRLGNASNGALSVQVLNEFFWNVTRKLRQPLTEADAERQVLLWVRSWKVFDLNPVIVTEAIRGVRQHQFLYWDALIWATARLNGVPNVLSEDFNDGALIDGVRFINPFRPAFDPLSL